MDWNNINEDIDTSGLGPIEYDQSKVPSLIRKHADNVRGKSYGQQVREAQARNAEYAGLIASEAEIVANNAEVLSRDTQNRFKDQIEGTTNSDEIIDARRPFGANAFGTLGQRMQTIEDNLNRRGVDILNPPKGFTACVGDGVADDTIALQTLIDNFNHLYASSEVTLRVTDTIRLKQRFKTLVGTTHTSSNDDYNFTILYDGVTDPRKAVVILGSNEVGAEPVIDASGLAFAHVLVDANDKAGFAVYGTYLTNETAVYDIRGKKALEYDVYFARSWHAYFDEIIGTHGNNVGVALGVPLKYLDGTEVNWTSVAALEMNNTPISRIRAHSNGRHFKDDNPGTFNLATDYFKGYGIGFGVGNGFNAMTYTSENNGGVNAYIYTSAENVKSIRNGYLENTMVNSGVADVDKTNLVIHHTSSAGDAYTIEDLFMNYASGGITYIGDATMRKVWLRNVHQPRFLRSLSGLSEFDLFKTVLKDHVYYGAGYNNTLETLANSTQYFTAVNTRYSFYLNVIGNGYTRYVYARLTPSKNGITQPQNTVVFRSLDDNTYLANTYPTLTSTGWTLIRSTSIKYNQIELGGSSGTTDVFVDFKVVTMPSTFI